MNYPQAEVVEAATDEITEENPALDSASVPPTCRSGRQAERRHPTQDPEQPAPPHPEHLDEQDADDQGPAHPVVQHYPGRLAASGNVDFHFSPGVMLVC
ncbi:hypothetical protein E4U16_002043 [Claviceps sp. LM84 group G4]|nr:hypothetical protein E4U16_002043 [Claviceps sp. LM84 group G4]